MNEEIVDFVRINPDGSVGVYFVDKTFQIVERDQVYGTENINALRED